MIVKLKIDSQMYADYLAYLFPPNEDGVLMVSSEELMGKLLISHCRESFRKTEISEEGIVVTLMMPQCPATQNLRNKFLYYSAGDMRQLNMALKAVFELDFTGYYRKAEGVGFAKKDIVEAFALSRKLITCDCYDALHKRVFRRQQKENSLLVNKLLRKAYYINETIDLSGLQKV